MLKSGYKHTQIAQKTKAFAILTSNETEIAILKPRILYDDLYLQSTRYSEIRNLLKETVIPSIGLSTNVSRLVHTVHSDFIAIGALNTDDI